jgi:hypothetical protein
MELLVLEQTEKIRQTHELGLDHDAVPMGKTEEHALEDWIDHPYDIHGERER